MVCLLALALILSHLPILQQPQAIHKEVARLIIKTSFLHFQCFVCQLANHQSSAVARKVMKSLYFIPKPLPKKVTKILCLTW